MMSDSTMRAAFPSGRRASTAGASETSVAGFSLGWFTPHAMCGVLVIVAVSCLAAALLPIAERRELPMPGVAPALIATLLGLLLLEVNRRFARVAVRAASLAGRQSELTQLVHELTEANDTLRRIARQDGLTLLANRRTLDEALELEWRRARREHQSLAVLMIDVDHFKRFNDRYGHPAGDACLRSLARVLDGVSGRSGDLAARYGGEEFALLLPGTDAHGARVIAQSLRDAVREAAIPHDASAAGLITVSIGAAAHVPTGDDDAPADLVAAADQALYRAKRDGRDRVATATLADQKAGQGAPTASDEQHCVMVE
jgi:diguanylate cyclase (GGDEF)-like protein